MKTLTFIIIAILSTSCNGKDDNSCNCKQEKHTRTVIKDMTSQNIISVSDWTVSGDSPVGIDCDSNGRITSSGSENSHMIGNNQYIVTEYKYQIKCN